MIYNTFSGAAAANKGATAGVKLANKAKVPVVALDQKPESAGAKISTFIATDSVKAAYTVCSWLFKQFNNSSNNARQPMVADSAMASSGTWAG